MFMYIGSNQVIESKTIIAILEYDLTTHSKRINELILKYKKKKRLFGKKSDAKSIIVTEDAVYFSVYSTHTLKNKDELFRSQENEYF